MKKLKLSWLLIFVFAAQTTFAQQIENVRLSRVAPMSTSDWNWTEITSFPFSTTLVFDETTPDGPDNFPSFFFTFTLTESAFIVARTDNNNAFFFFYDNDDAPLAGGGGFEGHFEAGTYFFIIDNDDKGFFTTEFTIEIVELVEYTELDYWPIAIGQTVRGDLVTPNVVIYDNATWSDAHVYAIGFRFPVDSGNFYAINSEIFASNDFGLTVILFSDPLTGDFSEDRIEQSLIHRWNDATRIANMHIFEADTTGYINLLFAFHPAANATFNFHYTITIEKIEQEEFHFVDMTLPFQEHLFFAPGFNTLEGESQFGDIALLRGFRLVLEEETELSYVSQAFMATLSIYTESTLENRVGPIHRDGSVFVLEAGIYYLIFSDDGAHDMLGITLESTVRLEAISRAIAFEKIELPHLNEQLDFAITSGAFIISGGWMNFGQLARAFTFTLEQDTTLYFLGGNTNSSFISPNMYFSQTEFDINLENVQTTSLQPGAIVPLALEAGTWYIVLGDDGYGLFGDVYTMVLSIDFVDTIPDVTEPTAPAVRKIVRVDVNETELTFPFDVSDTELLSALLALEVTAVLDNDFTFSLENTPFAWIFNEDTTQATFNISNVDFEIDSAVFETAVVRFAYLAPLTINNVATAGEPTASGDVRVGTEVALVSGTRENYNFTGWTVVAGDVEITNNSFIMPANPVEITANWEFDETTNIRPTETENPLVVWISNGTVHISGLQIGERFEIFTVAGIRVYAGIATCNVETLHATSLPNGIYILRTSLHAVRFVK